MELVVDATVVFTGLTGKGVTKRIVFLEFLKLHAPEALFREIEEHKSRIESISSLSSGDLETLMDLFRKKITSFPLTKYEKFLERANTLISDSEDTEYLALSLALDKCPIWSNDPHFKEQSEIKVYTTTELVRLLKSKDIF